MREFKVGSRSVGRGNPVFIVAEMSANHAQDYDKAARIIEAAGAAGADAVKLQTYTADTLTIDCDKPYFSIGGESIWAGRKLYELYEEAYTPWEWQPKLKGVAENQGVLLFSTPFDETAVDFLEDMNVPAYKLASFEVPHLPLIERIASTGKPLIMSTGMASLGEIEEAVNAFRRAGGMELALLRCISSYPARPEEMNLRVIPHLGDAFDVVTGLSDHTLTDAVSVASVALGGKIIEKHFTLSRDEPGPDTPFSLEPHELKRLIQSVREVEDALGNIRYGASEKESGNVVFRRSIFVVDDMKKGDIFTEDNIRIIRPGYGLTPRYFNSVISKRAGRSIERGTPMSWDLLQEEE